MATSDERFAVSFFTAAELRNADMLSSVLRPYGVHRPCCVHVDYRTRGLSAVQLSPVVKRTFEVRNTCECQHRDYERTSVSQTEGTSTNGLTERVFRFRFL